MLGAEGFLLETAISAWQWMRSHSISGHLAGEGRTALLPLVGCWCVTARPEMSKQDAAAGQIFPSRVLERNNGLIIGCTYAFSK